MKKIAQFDHVKVYWDAEWHEYVVKDGPREEQWHHTDDKEDALSTAQTIANQQTTN